VIAECQIVHSPSFPTGRVIPSGSIYWTKGKGAALWTGAKHKWSTLHKLLKAAGVPAKFLDGLTTNVIMEVIPGYMSKGKHGK